MPAAPAPPEPLAVAPPPTTLRLAELGTTPTKVSPCAGLESCTVRGVGWQRRWPLQAAGDGSSLYAAHVQVPRPGRYALFVNSPSLQLGVMQGDVGEHELGVDALAPSSQARGAVAVQPAMRGSP